MKSSGKAHAVAAKGALAEILQIALALLAIAMVLAHARSAAASQKIVVQLEVVDQFQKQGELYVGTQSQLSGTFGMEVVDEYGTTSLQSAADGPALNGHVISISEKGELRVFRVGSEILGPMNPELIAVLPSAISGQKRVVSAEALNSLYGERFYKGQLKSLAFAVINMMKAELHGSASESRLALLDPKLLNEEKPAARSPASVPAKTVTPVTEQQLQIVYNVDFKEDMVCTEAQSALSCKFKVDLALHLVVQDDKFLD